MICWVILGNISFLFSDFHFPSQDIGDLLWASVSNNVLISIAFQLKNCSFTVKGKVCFFRAPLQLCQLCTYLFHMEGIKICIIPNEGTIQGWICHCRRRSIVRGLSLFLPPPLQVESPCVSIRAIMPCFLVLLEQVFLLLVLSCRYLWTRCRVGSSHIYSLLGR